MDLIPRYVLSSRRRCDRPYPRKQAAQEHDASHRGITKYTAHITTKCQAGGIQPFSLVDHHPQMRGEGHGPAPRYASKGTGSTVGPSWPTVSRSIASRLQAELISIGAIRIAGTTYLHDSWHPDFFCELMMTSMLS